MKRELKHLLTITLILLGGNINCYSQKKELKKEKDGFQWYQLFTDDNHWGAQDINGKDIIPLSLKYSMVTMYDGLFMACNGDMKTLYTRTGKKIWGPSKSLIWIYDNTDDYYSYYVDGYVGILDSKGQIVISTERKYTDFRYRRGFYFMKKDKLWAAYDKSGHLIIPESRQYTSIYDCISEDGVKYFVFEKDGKSGACDPQGNQVLSPEVVGMRVGYLDYSKSKGFFYTENNKTTYCNVKIQERASVVSSNSTTTKTSTNQASSNLTNNSVPFAGYTRVAGGIPQVGEKRYWHKSGTFAYCTVNCYKASDGNVLYSFYPEPSDPQHLCIRYIYKSQSNGWYTFDRVNVVVYQNYAAYPRVDIVTRYDPIGGQLLISTDGKTVVDRFNNQYDTPINEQTANLLVQKFNSEIARGIGAGVIQLNNKPSAIEMQLKEDIEAIDRKQNARTKEEQRIIQQRNEYQRGHRTIRYNSTNTSSTSNVWCDICRRYDKPHTHPVND